MAAELINRIESQKTELKTSFGEEAIECIGAFANAQGGEIVVGVAPDGTVCGIQIGKKTLEDWAHRIQEATDPRLQPGIEPFEQSGRQLALIKIEPSSGVPVSVRGKFLKRVGRTNQRMSHEEVMQRLRSSAGSSWDAYVEVGASIDDLDLQEVREFLHLIQGAKRRPIPDRADEKTLLQKMKLTINGLPTRAALLLFGKDPTRYYPSGYIKLGRFRNPTLIVDDKRVDGVLLKQLDECMSWFRERFETEFVITGKPQRDVKWEYPLAAVREAVINAICHRDYSVNANIQIRLYDDRLEIWNPGGLSPALRVDDLFRDHDSLPRNRLIADCLFYSGIIENWGSGTTRMASILTDAAFPLPEFRVDGINRMHLTFRKGLTKEYLLSLGLDNRQIQLILQLKSGQPSVTNEQYQNEFAVSKSTASRELSDLAKKRLLLKHGTTGKGTYYALP